MSRLPVSPDEQDMDSDALNLFQEPTDYYPPEKPSTQVSYTLENGLTLDLRLVGHNPLWAHHLWNGAREIAQYLQSPQQASLLQDASVLELGGGAGLPSLVAALYGAKRVVLTDYPDAELVENMQHNVRHAVPGRDLGDVVDVAGYKWGARDVPDIVQRHLPQGLAAGDASGSINGSTSSPDGFRLLILADVNFNHSEHAALADTIYLTLSRADSLARALVFFTPYRPWLLEKDMDLFRVLRERGFIVEQICEKMLEAVMFAEDRGDERLRRTVFGFEVRWPVDGEGRVE